MRTWNWEYACRAWHALSSKRRKPQRHRRASALPRGSGGPGASPWHHQQGEIVTARRRWKRLWSWERVVCCVSTRSVNHSNLTANTTAHDQVSTSLRQGRARYTTALFTARQRVTLLKRLRAVVCACTHVCYRRCYRAVQHTTPSWCYPSTCHLLMDVARVLRGSVVGAGHWHQSFESRTCLLCAARNV